MLPTGLGASDSPTTTILHRLTSSLARQYEGSRTRTLAPRLALGGGSSLGPGSVRWGTGISARGAKMNAEVRVLLLEDNPADAELVTHELTKAHLNLSSRGVLTREAFLKELREFVPSIILADSNLPQFN